MRRSLTARRRAPRPGSLRHHVYAATRDAQRERDAMCDGGVAEVYHSAARLLALPPVRCLGLVLLTCRVGFAATDGLFTCEPRLCTCPPQRASKTAIV